MGTMCPADARKLIEKPDLPEPPNVGAGANGGGDGGEGNGEGDEDEDMCLPELLPGTYKFRVTGALWPSRKDVSWKFCSTQGTAQEELLFKLVCVDDRRGLLAKPPVPDAPGGGEGAGAGAGGGEGAGEGGCGEDQELICVPIELRTVDEVCYLIAKEMATGIEDVTLEGTIHLAGVAVPDELTMKQATVLKSAIAQEFLEADSKLKLQDSDVHITSWGIVGPSGSQTSRNLENAIGKLSFRVKVGAHLLGDIHTNVESAASNLKYYMQSSVSSGLFVAKVVSKATSFDESSLVSVNFAELLDLVVVHETKLNKEVSGIASVVVAVGALMGLVFGVIMFRSTISQKGQYAALSSASLHDSHA